ncbi:energy transducer TonB [Hymenobacter wooponensis]|nr:energy transducer TonB [Hymenobacter wooponensis]
MIKMLILLGVILLYSYNQALAQVAPAASALADTTLLRSRSASLQTIFSLPNSFSSPSLIDTPPQFKGGEAGLRRFLSQNFRFPPAMLRYQIEGWTAIRFIVDVNGDIRNPSVYKSLCQPWDDEVMRVVKLLDQKFQPATYNGRPVATPYSLSVPFSIK